MLVRGVDGGQVLEVNGEIGKEVEGQTDGVVTNPHTRRAWFSIGLGIGIVGDVETF